MAGSLVPFGIKGPVQCVFFFGAGRPVWEIRRHTDIGNPGAAMGLGEDKGMEIFQEAWGCLCSVPSAQLLWLSRF